MQRPHTPFQSLVPRFDAPLEGCMIKINGVKDYNDNNTKMGASPPVTNTNEYG